MAYGRKCSGRVGCVALFAIPFTLPSRPLDVLVGLGCNLSVLSELSRKIQAAAVGVGIFRCT